MDAWKVWYQPHPKFGVRHFSGRLTISPALARFAGKNETVTVDNARSIQLRMVGITRFVNRTPNKGVRPRFG